MVDPGIGRTSCIVGASALSIAVMSLVWSEYIKRE